MLIIRPEQMAALEAVTMKNFEDEMVEHLAVFAPRLYEIAGEKIFLEIIRLGSQGAKDYGFTMRGPVQFFIESMFTLGCNFDTDPQYPWCHEILQDAEVQDELIRADHLFDSVTDYLNAAVGADNQYVKIALKKLNNIGSDLLDTVSPDIKGSLLERMEELYPEKTQVIGKESLSRLIEVSVAVAQDHRIESKKGVGLVCLLMFMFGHGVTHDPLYPWIKDTLEDPTLLEQDRRIDKLANRTWTYTGAVYKYLSQQTAS
jgi:hypothetical protein